MPYDGQWQHPAMAIPANADCRGGVFAVFAKIPPPIAPRIVIKNINFIYYAKTVGLYGRYGMRMVAAMGGIGSAVCHAMPSPPTPTVGAGSSRFSRRFPRPSPCAASSKWSSQREDPPAPPEYPPLPSTPPYLRPTIPLPTPLHPRISEQNPRMKRRW